MRIGWTKYENLSPDVIYWKTVVTTSLKKDRQYIARMIRMNDFDLKCFLAVSTIFFFLTYLSCIH